MTPDRNKNFQLAQIFPLLMSFRIHNTPELHPLQCLHLYHRPTISSDQTFQIKIKELLLINFLNFNTTCWPKFGLIYSNQKKEIEKKQNTILEFNPSIPAGLLCGRHIHAVWGRPVSPCGHQEDLQALPVSHPRQENVQRTPHVETHEPREREGQNAPVFSSNCLV